MTRYEQVSIASRTFSLAALLGLSSVFDGSLAARIVLVVAIVAAMASYLSMASTTAPVWVLTGEMLLVGLVIGLTLPQSLILLPYPVVLALLAGLTAGWWGATLVVIAETAAVALVPLAATGFTEVVSDTELLVPWLSTSVVVGALGAGVRGIGKSPAVADTNDSYTSARRLLGQLHAVARRLPGGLDAHRIASQLLSESRSVLGGSAAALFTVTRTGNLAPMAHDGVSAITTLSFAMDVVNDAWTSLQPRGRADGTGYSETRFVQALPIRQGSRGVGVLVLILPERPPPQSVSRLMDTLEYYSLPLETTLLFDEIAASATMDERQRIAREIHDGIAQEVASLGYVVDELLDDDHRPGQTAKLVALRDEVSRVVSELRYSIFDLRSDARGGQSLGTALSEYLTQVGRRTGLTVHLTVDEDSARLPAAVETELFRIAQEAVTNVRKHAEAKNLWVDCWVKAPSARLCIRDDGKGLAHETGLSFGLAIMRERAEKVNARLEVSPGAPLNGGTTVVLELGDAHLPRASVRRKGSHAD